MAARRVILAATDFSAASRDAAKLARVLADALRADVRLLHVIPNPAQLPWSIDSGAAFPDLEGSWRMHAQTELERARDEAGLSSDTALDIGIGEAAHEILAHAHRHRADVIVLGTHGHGRIARLMLGSVADKVVRQAVSPVLVVPPAQEAAS